MRSAEKGYPHRDPPLTELGVQQAQSLKLPAEPDLILVSPMTRTIQTAMIAFKESSAKMEVWPELREAHDAECNKGSPRSELALRFPSLDFSSCSDTWDYPLNTFEDALSRAERVRLRLKSLSRPYGNIYLVTHRVFAAFLIEEEKFEPCGKFVR